MKACIAPTAIYVAAEDWGQTGLDSRIAEAANELVRATGGFGGPTRNAVEGAEEADVPTLDGAEEADSAHARTLEGTRARARDPFTNVPTMAEMLRR